MAGENGKRILIVDDNKSIRAMVSDYLGSRGYTVIEAADGIEGLEKALSCSAQAIILDVVMPRMDGFKLCRMLRDKHLATPIIMLTEKAEIDDKVEGFSRGADDYLAKPFSPLELDFRLQALLRRAKTDQPAGSQGGILSRGGMEIDLDRHSVTVDGNEVTLTPLEFNILKLLASAPGRAYSRQDLLNVIWDTSYEGYRRNIDPHVNRLRTKIEVNPKRPKYILTVWGIGYKFNESMV